MINTIINKIYFAFQINIVKTLMLRNKFNNITIWPNTKISISKTSSIDNYGKIQIGKKWDGAPNFKSCLIMREKSKLIVRGKYDIFGGTIITVNKNAVLELGSGFINRGCNIHVYQNIKIGNNVIIAEDVMIRDSDSHSLCYEGYKKTSPIKIEDNVWIGARATILKGVTIGSGSVVAAGSIVNKDVPSNCIVAGNPAKVIKQNITWKN